MTISPPFTCFLKVFVLIDLNICLAWMTLTKFQTTAILEYLSAIFRVID